VSDKVNVAIVSAVRLILCTFHHTLECVSMTGCCCSWRWYVTIGNASVRQHTSLVTAQITTPRTWRTLQQCMSWCCIMCYLIS